MDEIIREIRDSTWPTSDLAGFALGWDTTSPAIIAGFESPRPIASEIISSDEEGAREFYASVDEDELRDLASEALAAGGWTLSMINFRKS